jgi:bifunctional non-homologous end joining protein LigD
MPLELYHKKRDFKTTPEPKGRVHARKGKQLTFVVQKHAASRLHYDFRLELKGVLLSWAVPKGPSLDPSDKRLAMHTEDHPIEYGNFEGVIPPKQYGAGTVLLWDRGIWIPQGEDPESDYRKGKLKFQLDGDKLKGGWTLVRTRRDEGSKQSWLLIKERDEAARVGSHVTEELTQSVASGRELEDIAKDKDRVWQSAKSVKENVKSGAIRPREQVDLASVAGARKAAMPQELKPELATLVDAVPEGEGWVHETKYDGYRMLCRIEKGRAQLYTRKGLDWSTKFPTLIAALSRLPVASAWLDGEVVALGDDGRTRFGALQDALSRESDKSLVYFVFDLPYLEGFDLTKATLVERKRILKSLRGLARAPIYYSDHIVGHGPAVFEEACRLKLEGVISKRASSTYQSKRSGDWVKVKCERSQEFVIGGFTDPGGSRTGFGALLLGVYEPDGEFRYVGKVGTGFDQESLVELHRKLKAIEQPAPALVNPPTGAEARRSHWVKPQLVAEVSFTEWTQDGAVRHPSFKGLREDKPAREVRRERPESEAVKSPAKSPEPKKAARAKNDESTIAGITISNPNKALYPEGLTKRELALYYEQIGDWIVPHLKDRPLTLVRCPNGIADCFYQKNLKESVPSAIEPIEVRDSEGPSTYMMANSVAAVVGLVQMGVLEIHTWGSRRRHLDYPDRMTFDLDPDEGLSWQRLTEAAETLRTLLNALGLSGFLKTTGGKGLHVVVPIAPKLGWDEVKGFSKAVAEVMEKTFPDRFTAKLPKVRRKQRIYVDFLRNGSGATAISAYSARAKPNAPVSMPITWEELHSGDLRFDHFNVRNTPARLAQLKSDPWADYEDARRALTKNMMKQVGMV